MLKGSGVSPGVGIGPVFLVEEEKLDIPWETVASMDSSGERERFRLAVDRASSDLEILAEQVALQTGEEEAKIIGGHLLLLTDPALTQAVNGLIERESLTAEAAVAAACHRYEDMFLSMDDEVFRQRAVDLRDIKTRLLRELLNVKAVDLSLLPEGTVIAARELTPSMTAGIRAGMVAGIVTELGGKTSHTAILARAMEIPCVVAVEGLLESLSGGEMVYLDGTTGEVAVNPGETVRTRMEKVRQLTADRRQELLRLAQEETVTEDGVGIRLMANISNSSQIPQALRSGADGIGLFRTEFLFLNRNQIPTEEEQFLVYQKVAQALEGRPFVIRTLDGGGDKALPYLNLEKDENPFLGYRGIRLCLGRMEELLRPQLRAILRASAYGNIHILLPMVDSVEELRQVRALVKNLSLELKEQGVSFREEIPLGIMVETPAAVMMADVFAREADFFSIGTNDLTQYTLAVDRSNEKVAYLYSTFHPAVLRSIRHVIACAEETGILVGMCGEAAGDAMMIPLLLGLGLREFSMSAPSVLKARHIINQCDTALLSHVAKKVMELETAEQVEVFMREFIKQLSC